MERQRQDSRNPAEGDGKRADVSSEAGNLSDNTVKDLQKDVKELTNSLKEIKHLIKLLAKNTNNKIPGVE